MTPIQPLILQGPACVEFDGAFFFTKDGITDAFERETDQTQGDHADLGETMKSQRQVISFTPIGERRDLDKMFPYNTGDIGKRILNPFVAGAESANKPIKIHTFEDLQTITYPRAGLIESPGFGLGPGQTLFKDAMKFVALGDKSVEQTAAAFWKTLGANGTGWPAVFDETKMAKEIFHAAFGADPYDVISAHAGWDVKIAYGTKAIPSDEIGIADYVLESISITVKGAPANLTMAQVDTLLRREGEGALIPGQFVGTSDTDLILTSDSLTITLYKMGVKATGWVYKKGEHRFKELEWVGRKTWTAGVPNAAFLIEDNEAEA